MMMMIVVVVCVQRHGEGWKGSYTQPAEHMNIEYSHIDMISCVFFPWIDVLFIFLPGCYIYKSIFNIIILLITDWHVCNLSSRQLSPLLPMPTETTFWLPWKKDRYVCVNHQLICLKVSPECFEDQDDQIVDTIDWFTDTHSPVNLINKYWMISYLEVWRVRVMDWHDMRGWGYVLRCKSISTNTRRSKVLNKPQLSKQTWCIDSLNGCFNDDDDYDDKYKDFNKIINN